MARRGDKQSDEQHPRKIRTVSANVPWPIDHGEFLKVLERRLTSLCFHLLGVSGVSIFLLGEKEGKSFAVAWCTCTSGMSRAIITVYTSKLNRT